MAKIALWQVLVLLALLALALFAIVRIFPQATYSLTREEAISTALKDAGKAYPTAELRIATAEQANAGWRIRVKIALDAHSPCPRLKLRTYDLLPIRYREEDLIKECRVGGVIVYEEEAIIASLAAPLARRAAAAQARAWAQRVDIGTIEIARTCPGCVALPTSVVNAAKELNQSFWLVQWSGENVSAYILLNEFGGVIKEIS